MHKSTRADKHIHNSARADTHRQNTHTQKSERAQTNTHTNTPGSLARDGRCEQPLAWSCQWGRGQGTAWYWRCEGSAPA